MGERQAQKGSFSLRLGQSVTNYSNSLKRAHLNVIFLKKHHGRSGGNSVTWTALRNSVFCSFCPVEVLQSKNLF